MRLMIGIGAGELLDRLAILRIKAARVSDPAKAGHVRAELDEAEWAALPLAGRVDLDTHRAGLAAVNAALWDLVAEVHQLERAGDFGPRYVEASRAIVRENDRRSELKREINEAVGSELAEVKSFG